jgi:hypothetical protein
MYLIVKHYTRCDNLIPEMISWRQNLLICALTVTAAFEIFPSWNYELRETLVPLLENSLEICFPEYLALTLRCVLFQECHKIFYPLGHFLILERTKNRKGTKLGE